MGNLATNLKKSTASQEPSTAPSKASSAAHISAQQNENDKVEDMVASVEKLDIQEPVATVAKPEEVRPKIIVSEHVPTPAPAKKALAVEEQVQPVEIAKPVMEEFSIAGQKLRLDSADSVADYVRTLTSVTGVKVVNLSGNTLSLEACRALADALNTQEELCEVNVSDCFTGRMKESVPPAIEAFGQALVDKKHLRIVDFSDNAFSPAGATALSHFLANCTNLEELRLNNNGLGPEGGKIIAKALTLNREKTRLAGAGSSLRKITIGRNRLENGSAAAFAEAFKAHEGLVEVSMYQNGIRPDGIVMLSEGLSACKNLQVIDLQDNTFTNVGSAAFASAILNWPYLTRLLIGDCLISNEGCKLIIANLLKSPSLSTLKVFNLQYAEMEPDVAMFLAENLPKFTALRSLMLNGNCFSAEGAEVNAIRVALESVSADAELDELDEMDFEEDDDSDVDEASEGGCCQVVEDTHEPVITTDAAIVKECCMCREEPMAEASEVLPEDVQPAENVDEVGGQVVEDDCNVTADKSIVTEDAIDNDEQPSSVANEDLANITETVKNVSLEDEANN